MGSPVLSRSRLALATLATLALLGPGCEPPAGEVPRLEDTSGVDPALLARIEEALKPDDSGAWKVELAMVYDANGLFALALGTYRLCVQDDPERPELWYHLARMQAEVNGPEPALGSLDRCLALRDDYAPAHVRRGQWLLALGRVDDAGQAFARALDLDPGSSSAALGQARVELQHGRPEEVVRILEPVVERNPREAFANGLLARAYLASGDEGKADVALRREERAAPARLEDPWTARVYGHAVGLLVELERAGGALAQGDARTALAVLEPLHAERPDEFAVIELYSKALIQSGQNERAIEVLEAARQRHPDHYLLELSTGRALQGLGRLGPALGHLERSVELNPSFGEAHVALGEALFALGRFPDAERTVRRAIELHEIQVRTWILLARAQNRQEAHERAVASLEEALLEYPNSGTLWAYKADALTRAGRAADARAALERAAQRDPDHPLLPNVRQRLKTLEASSNKG